MNMVPNTTSFPTNKRPPLPRYLGKQITSAFISEMESEDSSDVYLSDEAFVERYFSSPSRHRAASQEGEGADFAEDALAPDSEEAAAAPLPAFNTDDPLDFQGSPISQNEYMPIPLSPEYESVISARIKRTSFVRQKVREKTGLNLPRC